MEQAFAKIKHWLRAVQKRTLEDTWRHIGNLAARECGWQLGDRSGPSGRSMMNSTTIEPYVGEPEAGSTLNVLGITHIY
jgi:hypothetical protein